jgi:hypothetical protein
MKFIENIYTLKCDFHRWKAIRRVPTVLRIWYCPERLAAFLVHRPKQSVCMPRSTANAPTVLGKKKKCVCPTAGA